MQFSVKVSSYQKNITLNICDSKLLGENIIEGKLNMNISKSYYGEKLVEKEEAKSLLKNSSVINMVGKEIVFLSTQLGIGSKNGIKIISGIPFLIVFKT